MVVEKLNTKEVDITVEYYLTDLAELSKSNVAMKITASGDLTHHVIEGIVDLLKKIQPTNPHLNNRPKCVDCGRDLWYPKNRI